MIETKLKLISGDGMPHPKTSVGKRYREAVGTSVRVKLICIENKIKSSIVLRRMPDAALKVPKMDFFHRLNSLGQISEKISKMTMLKIQAR